MTYQVLARKWRPKSFSDMAGQEHVLQTLVHALDNQRLHHAYLFTGTRGVGKTTIARIFAKCLNCEVGVSSTPCGKCSACTDIADGRFIDLIEVDAASKTKVEDTRELLENVQYAPSVGRYKVYLIDEVHMLSNHSFNALLKTLEEPPPHVVFLLATTDPHKLPITILSRCLQFSLKNLSPQKIVEYLQSVLIAEQIPFEEGALWNIAKAAQGSMRDALTLLDQSISFCAGNVTEAEVSTLLGTPDQALILEIIAALNAENASELLEIVSVIASRSFDYFMLLDNLLALLHRIAVAQLVPGAVDNSQGDREHIINIAKKLTAEEVQLYYQIALNGKKDMSAAFDARMAFEMLLLRMLVFSPQAPDQSHINAVIDSEPTPEQKKKTDLDSVSSEPEYQPTLERQAEPEPELEAIPEAKPEFVQEAIPAPAITQIPPAIDATVSQEDYSREQSIPVPIPEPIAPVKVEETTEQDEPELTPVVEVVVDKPRAVLAGSGQWHQVVSELGITGITGNLLANCVLESRSEDTISLVLDTTQSALYNEEHGRRIKQALKEYYGAAYTIELRSGEINTESPAQYQSRLRAEALDNARTEFENDKHVQALIDTFSAHIVTDSVSIINEVKK
ncbi:MAG: DNA polymerase III subunit gamma/tau [Gammaproteobacteria bacterium]